MLQQSAPPPTNQSSIRGNIARIERAFLVDTDISADRCYDQSVAQHPPMAEKKESINENISDEELESATGGRNRGDLKREVQERNRATDRRHRLRRNIPRDD